MCSLRLSVRTACEFIGPIRFTASAGVSDSFALCVELHAVFDTYPDRKWEHYAQSPLIAAVKATCPRSSIHIPASSSKNQSPYFYTPHPITGGNRLAVYKGVGTRGGRVNWCGCAHCLQHAEHEMHKQQEMGFIWLWSTGLMTAAQTHKQHWLTVYTAPTAVSLSITLGAWQTSVCACLWGFFMALHTYSHILTSHP